MKLSVYSIYDRKTCVYFAPMCYHNDEHMKRELSMGLKQDPRSAIMQFPHDYAVYQVGEWTDEAGSLTSVTPVRLVCEVSAIIKESSRANEPANIIPFGEPSPPTKVGGGGRSPQSE